MQEQIAHLRQLLDATKNMEPDSYSDLQTGVSPVPDAHEAGLGALKHEKRVARHSIEEVCADDKELAHSDFVRDDDDSEGDNEAEEDAESSLHLSSISNSSMRSDLSSLSSSLVGKRLKAKFKGSGSGLHNFEQSQVSASASSSRFQDDAATSLHDGAGEMTVDEICVTVTDEQAHNQVGAVGEDEQNAGNADGRSNSNRQDFELHEEEKKAEESDDTDDDEYSHIQDSPLEKLLMPEQYLKKNGALVDDHHGCFTVPTSDLHSFCVPRIKFSTDASSGYPSDSEDEEIRLIEQKYKRLLLS